MKCLYDIKKCKYENKKNEYVTTGKLPAAERINKNISLINHYINNYKIIKIKIIFFFSQKLN